MKSKEYILGYIISLIPIVLIQNILLFTLAIILGLKFSITIIYSILISTLISILFISIGIIIGSIFNEKASSGISSIIVQLVVFTSTMYFPKEMLGNFFSHLCNFLPFESSLIIIKGILNNNLSLIKMNNILIFLTYFTVSIILSIIIFNKKMINNKD